MPFEAILDEVDQLHNVSTRLEGLAERHGGTDDDCGKRSQHCDYIGGAGGDQISEANLRAAEKLPRAGLLG